MPNIRDLGGWRTASGRRVKQGLVYRSAGLNENAKPVFYTKEEMREGGAELKAEHDKLLPRHEMLQKAIDNLAARLDGAEREESLRLVPAAEWTMFEVNGRHIDAVALDESLAGMGSIPAEFMGAASGRLEKDSGGVLTYKSAERGKYIVLMQVVDAPRDGYMHFGYGTSRYWSMWVNGELLVDASHYKMKARHPPVTVQNEPVAVPVREGANLLVVALANRGEKLSWADGAAPDISLKYTIDRMRRILETAQNNLWRKQKARNPGATRLTAETRRYFLDTLGIRTDLDLRGGYECFGMTESPLGETVDWVVVPTTSYTVIKDCQKQIKEIIELLLDEDRYPLVFHCILGRDRTGSLAFIINGLMGVDLEDLYKDWRVTDFRANGLYNPSHPYPFFATLVPSLDIYPGGTLQEKLESYVISLGFSMGDIEKLRGFLLEEWGRAPGIVRYGSVDRLEACPALWCVRFGRGAAREGSGGAPA